MRSRVCGPLRHGGYSCCSLFLLASVLALASGYFDQLSVMREYAVNAERFARELRQHACSRSARSVRR